VEVQFGEIPKNGTIPVRGTAHVEKIVQFKNFHQPSEPTNVQISKKRVSDLVISKNSPLHREHG
jgi:hypothetical protein